MISTYPRLSELLRGSREIVQVGHLESSTFWVAHSRACTTELCSILVDFSTSLSSSFNSIQGLGLQQDLTEEQKGSGFCPAGLEQPELQGLHRRLSAINQESPQPLALPPLSASHWVEKARGHLALVFVFLFL